jgi:hypothetical protein
MKTIGRPLYKTIGRVIGKGAHLGSLLNHILNAFGLWTEDELDYFVTEDGLDYFVNEEA